MTEKKNGVSKWFFFLPLWVLLLAFCFAKVEIQIEGANGWAASLPTWRIEKGILLDIFWGGRTITGYHAWVFLFMALVFHLPVFMQGFFSIKLEARILGSMMIFWIVEDFLWFMLNPAFGLDKFHPSCIPWHKHWMLGVPTDYIVFLTLGAVLFWFSFRKVAVPNSNTDASGSAGNGGGK